MTTLNNIRILDPATVPDVIEFINKTEGNHPIIEDSRKLAQIKSELTEQELADQTEATKQWEKQING
jgi:hypothetical protein